MKVSAVVLLLVLLPYLGYATPSTCLQFDGGGSVTASSNSLPTGSSDRTIEFWVRFNSCEYYVGLVGWGSKTTNKFSMVATGPCANPALQQSLYFRGYDNDMSWQTSLDLHTWYHVAFTLRNNFACLYIDGELDYSGTMPPLDTSAGTTFWVSDQNGWGGNLHGSLDEIRVWNRALSSEEINAKMHCRLDAQPEAGLVLYWNLDEGIGTTVRDLSGHGNNGQVNGVGTWVAGAQLAPMKWSPAIGGNGHSYDLVRVATPISWLAAKAQAESMGGYLATITSQSENDWVWEHIVHPAAPTGDYQVLLGGLHDRNADRNTGWSWVTGEPWSYKAWRQDEPSGDPSGGDRGDFLCYASCTVQGWNDTGDTPPLDPNYYYLVECNGTDLQVSDVPSDQGGFLQMRWNASPADAAGMLAPIISYDAQRLENGSWATLATMAAAQADSYQVTVPTPDIFTVGQAAPFSCYRVVANTSNPSIFYSSPVDSAYSIDNIAPPKPDALVVDGLTYRYIVWTAPAIADLASMCVYRGSEAGFNTDSPIACPTTGFYSESHLAWYFYRVQFTDTHGNLSEFSDELHGQYPTGVDAVPPAKFALEQNQPNPFNPSTTIKFSLANAAPVSLGIYDVAGKLVRNLIAGQVMGPGQQEKVWDGSDDTGRLAPAGVYFYKLSAGEFVEVRRMALVK